MTVRAFCGTLDIFIQNKEASSISRSSADLGSGNVRKLLFRLALPIIVSQLVNMLCNLVDRIYIGRIAPVETVDKPALTGAGVCLPTILIISSFASLMAAGGAPRASIAAVMFFFQFRKAMDAIEN